VVRLSWRNRRHQSAADQNTEQEDDDPPHERPRCAMAARRLGGNLARISGSVHGGALDLAAGTIEAWHARNAACVQARAQMWEMWMTRLLSIALATLMLAGAAVAQTSDAGWPDRPIRLVVPFPAGSSTDIVARIIAQKLGQRLGQQIVVENRAGASGNIGVDAVAKAAP